MIFFQIQSKANALNAEDVNVRLRYVDEFTLEPYLSNSLFLYMSKMKDEITTNTHKWDRYKKYTNVYEYVHTVLPEAKMAVCKLKPISRSFYKMLEIMQCFHILKEIESREEEGGALRSFHLAEGPGGFVEALLHVRKRNPNDVYYGMTLQSSSQNTPGWKKSLSMLNKNSNGCFCVVNGEDGTGDVTQPHNFRHCVEHYGATIDLVTADGGFDFTVNFNQQERLALRLVMAEVFTALALQRKGGYFVLKIYDVFMKATVELIFMLCGLYDTVFLYKPHMSRAANSEKYLICKCLLHELTPEWHKRFYDILTRLAQSPDYVVESVLDVEIDNMFLTKMNEICSVIGQQQLENISSTLNLIHNPKNDRIESYKRNNVQHCVTWCIKHDLPYNDVLASCASDAPPGLSR